MPKVSVILTSFNHAKYICEAIDSVLNQTFTDFELIIVDDASNDGSWEIIKGYSDARVKKIRSKTSGKINRELNRVISELAAGEYVAIHHSDDVWELDKLEKQVAFLDENPIVGAVFTWAQVIDENSINVEGDWFIQENRSQWSWLSQLFNAENHLNHPSVLVRKECYKVVGTYKSSLFQIPDAEFWTRLLIRYPIHIIQEKLTKHRKFSNMSNVSGVRHDTRNRTNNEWNVLQENFLSVSNFEDLIQIFPTLEKYRNSQGFDIKFLLAMACLDEKNHRSAWQLGLRWLFELIENEVSYKKIRKLYSFSELDLYKLTGQFDIYSITNDDQIAKQYVQILERDLIIEGVYASWSWRLTKPLRFLGRLIRGLSL